MRCLGRDLDGSDLHRDRHGTQVDRTQFASDFSDNLALLVRYSSKIRGGLGGDRGDSALVEETQ